MAVYAIGDLQGCYGCLMRLLDKLHFDPSEDKLWFTGDLVNRGPDSLATLRFVKGLGKRAVTVLGNHDLHLLALAEEVVPYKRKDTLRSILDASDRKELLGWLRQQPLLHYDKKLRFTMVHAGLSPQWKLKKARKAAREVEKVLRGKHYRSFLKEMYGDMPDTWSDDLKGWERLRYITNALTRMRCCDRDGRMDMSYKGSLVQKGRRLVPWFRVPGRANRKHRIVFGHWSTLGPVTDPNIYPLDSGCVWGGYLTALRLDQRQPKRRITRCPMQQRPKSAG
jgi:bis(5'-nucleosyl)-tetraphosphatase (symmetrical)